MSDINAARDATVKLNAVNRALSTIGYETFPAPDYMARWTTKALSRKGYKITSNAPLELFVNEENKSWTLKFNGEIVVTHSIEEALKSLSYLN